MAVIPVKPIACVSSRMVLDYRPGAHAPGRRAWWVSLLLVLSALPAAASTVLVFAWKESPSTVVIAFSGELWSRPFPGDWQLGFLAAPFFLALPILAWHIRAAIQPGITRLERASAWVFSLVSTAISLTLVGSMLAQRPTDPAEWAAIVGTLVIFVVGAGLLFVRRATSSAPMMAMMVAYSANAITPLIAFRDGHDLGWHATLIAVILQMLVVVAAVRHAPTL